MTTKPSSTPLVQDVAEILDKWEHDVHHPTNQGIANQATENATKSLLQLIKGKLPKEMWASKDEYSTAPLHHADSNYLAGYNTAIKEIRELLGDGNE